MNLALTRVRAASIVVLAVQFLSVRAGSEPPRPLQARFSSPAAVWWDADLKSFVVWNRGPNSLQAIDPSGANAAPSPADFDARASARLELGAGVAWIDPRQPKLWLNIKETGALRAFDVPPRPQALAADPDRRHVWLVCDSTDRPRTVLRIETVTGQTETRDLPGASNVRGIAVSPDGEFAVVTHLVPKSNLPSTQIEQGWVFTNAVSVVPRRAADPIATIPLDLRTQGFANPEGVALSPDGRFVWIAHSGADLISVVDLPKARSLVTAEFDLTKTRRYVRTRISVGSCPTGIAFSGDGRTVAATNRLSDNVTLIDAQTFKILRTVAMSENPDVAIRRGERLFFSAKLSHSGQFSCASCHPDGQADGLNWDLPADGFNNFQNTKSLLDLDGTAPYGWLGTTPSLAERFSGTLRHLFQHEPAATDIADIAAYLAQLQSPERPAEVPPELAAGKALFFGKAGCQACHSGAKLTDLRTHDVLGGDREYDTPSLRGVLHTPPYLHDGRAPTLESLFRNHNPSGLHGHASELSPEELRELIGFVKSQ